jgi:preprotein translocase subunit SecF
MTRLASKRKLWFTISLLVIIPGIISLIFSGLKLGIDFTGGTLWEVRFSEPATAIEIETVLRNAGVETVIVQRSGPANDETFLIRMPEVTEGSARKAELVQALETSVGPFTEREYSTVGGALSTQIRNRAILAVALASVGILIYMATPSATRNGPSSTAARRWWRCCMTCWLSWGSFRFWACSSTSRSTRSSSPRC